MLHFFLILLTFHNLIWFILKFYLVDWNFLFIALNVIVRLSIRSLDKWKHGRIILWIIINSDTLYSI